MKLNSTELQVVVVVALVIGIAVYTIARGEETRVRYVGTDCIYYLIYENTGAIDLVGIGGSRMMTSFDADDVERKLAAIGKPNRVVYNMSQSHFSLEKSYVVFRDLIERRKVKTAVIMLEPRQFAARPGQLHEKFLSVAKLSDIPLALSAVSSENPLQGIRGISDMIKQKLKIPPEVPSCLGKNTGRSICNRFVHQEGKTRNCHSGDYRFNLDVLNNVTEQNKTKTDKPYVWNFDDDRESFNDTYIRALKKIADGHEVSLFFVYLNRSTRANPDLKTSEIFEEKYGLPLLVLPRHLEHELATMGRRDEAHIYSKGREKYLPWLFRAIQKKCPNPEGCL
ncbi:hypothetical protein [Pelagibius sp. Alg239-R121]|uniref:hypothetical protein n=1 Tax=Pelagibius sp. Alg239-R121 TaxID=2993448 RepID=UPI0024A632D1|nr:hypothetical protein [Pelagibius sp. Alg239-R121]